MKIVSVQAKAYSVPVEIPFAEKQFALPLVITTIATNEGIRGHGLCTSPDFSPFMAAVINNRVAPFLKGSDALNTERIWHDMHRQFNNWALTGVWSWIQSSIDIALWDIKGKALGQSVAGLLGGARDRVPTYLTFGVTEHDQEGLVAFARQLVEQGHVALKMVVGGLRHRSAATDATNELGEGGDSIGADVARVAAVREAVGPDVAVMVDANCRLGLNEAERLAREIAPFDISWFEEPVVGNDPSLLSQLRGSSSIPVAAGQRIGHSWAHRELVTAGAVDILQPNVLNGGGYTECAKTAALARAYNIPITTGGAWPHHNLHLHAGLSNGGSVEYHWLAWKTGEVLYHDPPTTANGEVRVPSSAGLGFEPRSDEELEQFAMSMADS